MGTHGASVFILTAVDDVWVCKLRDPTTFYTGVLPSDILKHLQECCKGLHAIKTVNPPLIIQGYYADASSIPVYVNIIGDSHHKYLSTNLPLSNTTLLATSTKSVYSLQEYQDQSRKWECEPKDA